MGPVVVATDLSAPGDEAILQGHEQARARGVRLVVCHVIPDLLSTGGPMLADLTTELAVALPRLRERAAEDFQARVAALTGRGAADFETRIEYGTAHARIVELGESLDASLVVVGSHGSTVLRHALLGGVAEKVVRHAVGPVLIARACAATGVVVAGTDFSDAALPAITAGAAEARRLGGTLTVVHSVHMGPMVVAEPALGAYPPAPTPEQRHEVTAGATRRLDEALKRVGATANRSVAEEPPPTALVRRAEELGAQLVVVGSHGRTGLRRLLLGSVAEAVVRNAPCSVLVVRLKS